VATVVSDFMIAYMGLKAAACSFKLPEGLTAGAAAAVTFTADEAQALSLALDGEFERYRWLGKLMEELVLKELREANVMGGCCGWEGDRGRRLLIIHRSFEMLDAAAAKATTTDDI
jgi:hypothetical protein